MRLIDIEGQQIGLWKVLSRDKENKSNGTCWVCKCFCGNMKSVRYTHLRSGKSLSCGCIRDKQTGDRSRTHGLSKTRIYRIWRNMINRCHYENYKEFKYYGGRGIVVCDRWRQSFQNFLNDMGVPDDDLSIDRINNDGNYEPTNCRWATSKEQAQNRRNSVEKAKG